MLLPVICFLFYLCGIDGLIYKVCDGELATLGCKSGKTLQIKSVSYCGDGTECHDCCDPDYSIHVVSQLCNNQDSCVFPCDKYMFDGVCPTGRKCLTIEYTCERDPNCDVSNPNTPRKCGPNEEWSTCRSACPPTCPHPLCPVPIFCTLQCLPPGCACRPGYVRDRITGVCVNPDYCPRYDEPNERFSKCNADVQEYCPSCQPGYVCRKPLVRNPFTGYCVHPKYCPKETGCTEK